MKWYAIALYWAAVIKVLEIGCLEKECKLKKVLEALQTSEATYEQPKNIGGEDNPIPINTLDQHKKSAKTYSKYGQPKNPHRTCKYCGGKYEAIRTQCLAYAWEKLLPVWQS